MQKEIFLLTTELGTKMKQKNLALVTAESCTGGGIAYYISINPDCSPILERAYVCYSNSSKQQILNIKPFIVQTKGAVSEEVAVNMATGGLKNSDAQVCLAVTGAIDDKIKKGLIWICCTSALGQPMLRKKTIIGNREHFCNIAILYSQNNSYIDKNLFS